MTAVEVGTELPVRTTRIEPGRMKVFSLLTDDSNPIHWDREAVVALGLGDRLVNQGGLNVGYVVNAVADWAGGHDRIVSVRVRFLGTVREGDEVRAGGVVSGIDGGIATIDAHLLGPEGERVIVGTVRVVAPE